MILQNEIRKVVKILSLYMYIYSINLIIFSVKLNQVSLLKLLKKYTNINIITRVLGYVSQKKIIGESLYLNFAQLRHHQKNTNFYDLKKVSIAIRIHLGLVVENSSWKSQGRGEGFLKREGRD